MKNILLLIGLSIISCPIYGQDRDSLKATIRDQNVQLNTKPLWWIKTSQDFPQAAISVEQIDSKIDSIILKQENKAVIDIETPINLKKLKYYGLWDVNKVGIIEDSALLVTHPNEYGDASGVRDIFQYGNIKVLCKVNTNECQLQVYSIIRGILILKNKYPEIYKNLFTATETSPLSNDKLIKDKPQSSSTYLNMNRSYVFSVHDNPARNKALPTTTSSYSLSYKDHFLDRWVSDNNTHLIFLNIFTLRNGGAAQTTASIYKGVDAETAHINFLLDGIIQTIVHERLHNYIANQKSLNQFFDYIRNNNEFITDKVACENSTYLCLEEPVVTNTTNKLFEKYGGISEDVMTYYKDLFNNRQLTTMKSSTEFNSLISKLKGLNTSSKDNEPADVLTIHF